MQHPQQTAADCGGEKVFEVVAAGNRQGSVDGVVEVLRQFCCRIKSDGPAVASAMAVTAWPQHQ
jgi:hypothetical protein